jgi:hypothetical protein
VKINQLETSLRQKTKRNIKRKKEIPRKKREREDSSTYAVMKAEI